MGKKPRPRWPPAPATEAEKGPPPDESIGAALKSTISSRSRLALVKLVNSPNGRAASPADHGAAPLAGDRDGIRVAPGAHPRQRIAQGQHIRPENQGGRRRHRPQLARPALGDGPTGAQVNLPDLHTHGADLRTTGRLGQYAQKGEGDAQELHRGRPATVLSTT